MVPARFSNSSVKLILSRTFLCCLFALLCRAAKALVYDIYLIGGQLTVEQVVFENVSRLEIELGGLLPGTEYDQLLAHSVTLSGDLAVSLLNLGDGVFLPAPTDSFTVVDATTLTGMFDNVVNRARLDTTDGEGSFLVSYDSVGDKVLLSSFVAAASPGDFDGDGDRDGRDFLLWQRGELPNPLSAADLLLWENAYGIPSNLAVVTSVPEPATLLMCGIGLLASFFARARNIVEDGMVITLMSAPKRSKPCVLLFM